MEFQRGWGTYEPIAMPRWDLNLPAIRAKAREYLVEVDPDFVVLSPPCGAWGQTRVYNQGTPWQMRELQRKKEQARELLVFVEEVVHYQHRRGRALVVENPRKSLMWEQAPIQSAMSLPGMSAVKVDMCAYAKRRPVTGQ